MKRAALITLAAVAAISIGAFPAVAQNASQIASAQRGANCSGCNLFQADLQGKTLKGRNFAHARLRQADMSLGIFNGSNFSATDMRDVNAYGALFSSASFVGANLTNASFVGTYLEGANFSGATLTGANFSGAEMDRARGLTQARLDGACGDEATRLPAGLRIRRCR